MSLWDLLKLEKNNKSMEERLNTYNQQKREHQREQRQIKREGGYLKNGTWTRYKE